MAFLNENLAAVLVIVLVLGVAAAIVAAALLSRGAERRQARALGRLRHDSDRQAQALARLGENLNAAVRQIDALSGSMENRQDRMRRTLDERMELMNQANERRLEQMQALVTDKLDGRLSESFQVINGQLAGVHRGLGEMRELALGVTDLKKMLGGVKTRGVWGEAQLRALLEQVFAPGQYVENAAIPAGSQTRVEFALRMPTAGESEPLLPIDSKFPQEDYLRLVEASASGDAELARRCAAQLERAVLEQAKLIHDKYIRPPQTTDFAVMFLPTESLYAEVARRDGLLERVQERWRVLVAGPATLCALLTSIQMGLRTCTLEKRSGEVLNLLSAMKQDFAHLDESIQRMRQRLGQAEIELDALEQRARKAVSAIEKVDEFQE
ncbi:MAG: DNA recombination protein RmuC [Clostridia bacterium]|nr:DNA recombination protein RmuC [Clostridia bacterium]